MTRALPRTSFHSSTLIRQLADLGVADLVDPGSAFAEKLGLWVHFADAIALSALHLDPLPETKVRRAAALDGVRASAAGELARTRTLLTDAIMTSCAARPGKTHIRLPAADFELPLDPAAAFLPYRRFYVAHQRDMELGIQPLRVNLRDALAKASPRLRQLAELDAAFDKILRERESKLLSRVPVLLGKRFGNLYREHQHRLADAGQADDPLAWTGTGGWLARFCQDMQQLLLSELELRLQPAMGLLEAFNQDMQ